jgi:hypothetical protein
MDFHEQFAKEQPIRDKLLSRRIFFVWFIDGPRVHDQSVRVMKLECNIIGGCSRDNVAQDDPRLR